MAGLLLCLAGCASGTPVRPTAAVQAWWELSGGSERDLARVLRQHGFRLDLSDTPAGAEAASDRRARMQLGISASPDSPDWQLELRTETETRSLQIRTAPALTELLDTAGEDVRILALEQYRDWLEPLLARRDPAPELRWHTDLPSESQIRRLAEDLREEGSFAEDGITIALLGRAGGAAINGLSSGGVAFATLYPPSTPRPDLQRAWATVDRKVVLTALLGRSARELDATVMFAPSQPIVRGERGEGDEP